MNGLRKLLSLADSEDEGADIRSNEQLVDHEYTVAIFGGALLLLSTKDQDEPQKTLIESGFGISGRVFAMDAFGTLYVHTDSGSVVRVTIESPDCDTSWGGLDEWINDILIDHRALTGWPFWYEWAETHGGKIDWRYRLSPKIPFVLGGSYEIENLELLPWVDAFKRQLLIGSTIKGLEDGAQISWPIDGYSN